MSFATNNKVFDYFLKRL